MLLLLTAAVAAEPSGSSASTSDPAPAAAPTTKAEIGGVVGARGTYFGPGLPGADTPGYATWTKVSELTGKVTMDAVSPAVAALDSAINGCWTAARASSPPASGSVALQVSFRKNGTASGVTVLQDGAGSAELTACLTRLLLPLKVNGSGTARVTTNCKEIMGKTATNSIGSPIIVGDVDAAALEAVAEMSKARVLYCYQRGLVRSPDLTGIVTTEVSFAADGHVTQARTTASTLQNPEVEACIEETFRRTTFPGSPSGGSVTWPFTLQPG